MLSSVFPGYLLWIALRERTVELYLEHTVELKHDNVHREDMGILCYAVACYKY